MQNWRDTVLSQYANSPVLLSMLERLNDAIDPALAVNAWWQQLWNVDTAQGYGLDVWGRIVGITRYLTIPVDEDYFGFDDGSSPGTWTPFNDGVFYSGSAATQTYALSDSAYRGLILFKAFANIARTDIPSLNRLINVLFSGIQGIYVVNGYVVDGYFSSESVGRAYVEDLGGMVMRYRFEYTLSVYQQAIINTPGVLPHPAGVTVLIG